MHFLWCVQLITFTLRDAFKLHMKIFIRIYIQYTSSSHNDTSLKTCFILCVCVCVSVSVCVCMCVSVCVCVWGGEEYLSAEQWVFILIRENVTFFVSFKCTVYSMVFGGGVQCCPYFY